MLEMIRARVKTYASEARHIRKEERKLQGVKDFESQAGVRRGSGYFRHQKDQPRPEPRKYPEPRDDTQKVYDDATAEFFNLHRYRTVALRREARVFNLAYGFLKGIPYAAMEQKTHDGVSFFVSDTMPWEFSEKKTFDVVRREAKKLHNMTDQEFAQKWAQWYDAAKEHLKLTHPDPVTPVAEEVPLAE